MKQFYVTLIFLAIMKDVEALHCYDSNYCASTDCEKTNVVVKNCSNINELCTTINVTDTEEKNEPLIVRKVRGCFSPGKDGCTTKTSSIICFTQCDTDLCNIDDPGSARALKESFLILFISAVTTILSLHF
ncbi:uncharacterized protein LOC143459980 [Clavelina lepadiformis]|uniref:Uncharacterized protein n=1 Tax=Clavelina lepadiformis TaxID=159417 RepID=A0ABP0FRZ4_CLALP